MPINKKVNAGLNDKVVWLLIQYKRLITSLVEITSCSSLHPCRVHLSRVPSSEVAMECVFLFPSAELGRTFMGICESFSSLPASTPCSWLSSSDSSLLGSSDDPLTTLLVSSASPILCASFYRSVYLITPPVKTASIRDRSFFMREGGGGVGAGGIWEKAFKNRMTPPQLTNFFTWLPLRAVTFVNDPPPPPLKILPF